MSESPEQPKRFGHVALVGRPNAGKSTLANTLLGEKLAIVSDRPQTTRQRLMGVLTEERGQIVFLDTPGVHKPRHRMNRRMVKSASEALSEADVLCLLVDASQSHGRGDEFMLEFIERVDCPKILLLNKIDLVKKSRLLPRMALYADTELFEEIVPISALNGDGADLVLDLLFARLPAGEPRYDPELLTTHPERFLVAERIREKILPRVEEEIPFSVAVMIDRWEEVEGGELTKIYASILVERPGQKSILVGHKGSMIKDIGIAAREDLEEYLGTKVYLELFVKLEERWRESDRVLGELDREFLAGTSTD